MPEAGTCAFGLAPHSGWAAAVILGGTASAPRVLARERLGPDARQRISSPITPSSPRLAQAQARSLASRRHGGALAAQAARLCGSAALGATPRAAGGSDASGRGADLGAISRPHALTAGRGKHHRAALERASRAAGAARRARAQVSHGARGATLKRGAAGRRGRRSSGAGSARRGRDQRRRRSGVAVARDGLKAFRKFVGLRSAARAAPAGSPGFVEHLPAPDEHGSTGSEGVHADDRVQALADAAVTARTTRSRGRPEIPAGVPKRCQWLTRRPARSPRSRRPPGRRSDRRA